MKLTTGFLGVVIYFSTTRGLWWDKILCKWLIFNGIILLRNIQKKKMPKTQSASPLLQCITLCFYGFYGPKSMVMNRHLPSTQNVK